MRMYPRAEFQNTKPKTDRNGEKTNPVKVEDFKTPLSVTDSINREKISKMQKNNTPTKI